MKTVRKITRKSEKDLKGAILCVVRNQHGEIPLDKVIASLKHRRRKDDENAVKSAIWYLIAKQELELTPNRKLHSVER